MAVRPGDGGGVRLEAAKHAAHLRCLRAGQGHPAAHGADERGFAAPGGMAAPDARFAALQEKLNAARIDMHELGDAPGGEPATVAQRQGAAQLRLAEASPEAQQSSMAYCRQYSACSQLPVMAWARLNS